MEARKLLTVLSFAALAACDTGKSSSTVFPESRGLGTSVCSGARINDQFIVEWENGDITLEHAENSDTFTRDFLEPKLNEIHRVEFNKHLRVFGGTPAQCPAKSAGFNPEWHLDIIGAKQAWAQNARGAGVTVAVVDTGVDYDHPQLKNQLAVNQAELNGKPGIDDDGNGCVDDIYGCNLLTNTGYTVGEDHGTHVAGLIAADPSVNLMTGYQPVGVAPQAKILGAKFLGAGNESGTVGQAIRAIRYAVDRGAKVINASWGGDDCSTLLRDTIGIYAANSLFLAASGNDGKDLEVRPSFPAAYTILNMLTIAATRANDLLAGFSNTSLNYVHLGAPGDKVVSTVPYRPGLPISSDPGNLDGYDCYSGTSMATPVVSGAAAVLWSAYPNATVDQIRNALLKGVDVKDYRVQTRGRLNIVNSLEVLRRGGL